MRAGGLSRRAWLAGAAAAVACGARNKMAQETCPQEHADGLLVIRGGAIITGDPALPVTTALAAAGGRVVAHGPAAEALARDCPKGQILELAGGCAVPGLVDAHAHLAGLGLSLAQVDLRGARSIEEVVARLVRRRPVNGSSAAGGTKTCGPTGRCRTTSR